MWNEILHDPKMGRLPDNLWRRFVELCLMANEMNMNGRLPPVHDIGWRLRMEEEALRLELDQLARVDLIEYVCDNVLDGYWAVTNFEKRQERMTAAERMRRKRERDKSQRYYDTSYDPVTERNTDKKREEEDKEEEETAAVFSHFQNEIAILSPTLADKVRGWLDEYTAAWIIEAIDISVSRNKRRPDYVEGILRNWHANGKDSGMKKKQEVWAEEHY